VDNGLVPDDPPLPKYPGHSAAFGEIVEQSGLQHPGNVVRAVEPDIANLMKVRDAELVLLHRIGIDHHSSPDLDVSRRTIDVEIARRSIEALRLNRDAIVASTAALVEFKQEAATASSRLETLTRWLIVFTCAVVLLTVVLVVHDLTR
jgi:hypothetical protein